jgi:hypothetical protein
MRREFEDFLPMSTKLSIVILAFAVLLGESPSAASQQKAAQQTVAVADLPAAVTASVAKSYPGSTIVSAAKMSRGKQERYELSVKPAGDAAPVAVMVSPTGEIRTNAKGAAPAGAPPAGKGARKAGAAAAPQPFPIADLPKPVVKAIKDAYPKDTITSATKSTSGSKVFFQVTLNDVSSTAPMHVTVTEDGQIQKR